MCQDGEDEESGSLGLCGVELNSCIINAPLGRRFGQTRNYQCVPRVPKDGLNFLQKC